MIRYRLSTSKEEWIFNEEGDPEDREWYIPKYPQYFDSYGACLLATEGLPDWKIERIETITTFVASSEDKNAY